jgi:transporter family-2 protein
VLYLFAIAAGLASAVQAACTGSLMRGLQNPFLVVLTSLIGSVLVTFAMVAASSAVGSAGLGLGRAAGSVPWWAWLAGACGAVVLLSQPVSAHSLGAATYIGLMVSSAVVASVLLDHFGALGFVQHTAGIGRVVGATLMVAGVTLVAWF